MSTATPAPASVPTTRIAAIGSFPRQPTPDEFSKLMPLEVPATLRLYLEGKIDQWFVRKDRLGVLFLMTQTTVEDAHAVLATLPLSIAGLMSFELIPLGPLEPLGMLL